MPTNARPSRGRRRGQGMVEYIIIIAVVAVLTLGIVIRFGDQIRNLFVVSGEQLAGEDSTDLENKMEGAEVDQGLEDL